MTPSDNDGVMATPCEVALRLGHELDRLGTLADNLQGAIAGLGTQDHVVEAVQSLDLMTQSLFALSGFIAEWALILDASAATDISEALARVSLADVGCRLAAIGGRTAPGEAGALEMFAEDV